MKNDISLFARHFYKLGFNVTCISNIPTDFNFQSKNILKCPNHDWQKYYESRQTIEEFQTLDFDNALGLGTTTAFNNLLVIDIDGCLDSTILPIFLSQLGLPRNYEWVIQTGSRNGFHIYVYCKKFEYLEENTGVCTYPPNEGNRLIFEKVELLWRSHSILPPSLHISSFHYRFLNCKVPQKAPLSITQDDMESFIQHFLDADVANYFCEYSQETIEWKKCFYPRISKSEPAEEFDLANNSGPFLAFVDLETDGLRTNNTEPNIIQIAWLITNLDGQILKEESYLINTEKLDKNNAFDINNISIGTIKQIGIDCDEALKYFTNDLAFCHYLVAHNINFDVPIINNHLKKAGMPMVSKKLRQICTMTSSVEFCAIEGKSGLRYPKLSELYAKLFKKELNQVHNAELDVLVTAKCFRELLSMNVITLPPLPRVKLSELLGL